MREYRVVILGSGGVGKSSLTIQFAQGIFVNEYDHLVEDSYRKAIEFENTVAMLEILDMPTTDATGTKQSMRDLYIRNGHGFVVVYSVTSNQSFGDVLNIRDQILRLKGTDRVPMVLVGNKADLEHERQVPTSEGMIIAKCWGVPFYESSAKNTHNVNDIFTDCAVEVMHKLSTHKQTTRNCCCGCILM